MEPEPEQETGRAKADRTEASDPARADADAARTGRRRPRWLRLVLLVAIVVGGILLFRYTPLADHVRPREVARFFRELGDPWWAPAVFIPFYALGTALGLPGTIPTLAGGAIFGVLRGTLFNWIGANLGAVLAFLLARHLGRDFVARVLRGRAADLDRRIGDHGFRTMLYLRLIPVVPFNGLNFGAGISRISLRDYVLGSAIGMLPGTFVYTYFADALIRGTAAARREAFIHFLLAAAALVAFTLITDWIRRRRAARTGTPS